MKQKTVFSTLFSIFLVIILVSIGTSAIYSTTTFTNFTYKTEKASLIEKTEILLSLFPVKDLDNINVMKGFAASSKNKQTRITIVKSDGTVLSDSIMDSKLMNNHLDRPEIKANLLGKSTVVSRYSDTLGEKMIYYSLPITKGETILGFLRTSISVESLNSRVKIIGLTVFIISLVIILISVAVCYALAMKFSQTVNSIKKVADYYSKGDFNYTLSEDGTREIVSLSKSINNMGELLKDRFFTIKKQKNRYKSMLESMVEPVIRIDNNFIIDEMNNSAILLFNKSNNTFKNIGLLELTLNTDLYDFVKETLSGSNSKEKIIAFNLDKEFHFKVHASVLYDAEKEKLGVLLVMSDLTEHIRLENMRKEFVANVSHELRTPTTAIQGYIETLLTNKVSNEQQKKFMEILHSHSIRLNSIIDDLLVLAGLEKSDSSFNFEEFSIQELILSAINGVSSKIDPNMIILENSNDIKFYAHPLLLEQAIINLITNAVKYGNNKPIYISFWKKNNFNYIEVKDSGCGISEVNQEHIFERFYRVDRARSREQGGTGLGLSIVKRVMDIHGGTASVQSVIDYGSVFTLSIPCCNNFN